MSYQPLQLLKMSDLYRFHRYIRSNHIHGTVRQNQFSANARNTFTLALALPLEAATLEIRGRDAESICCFESRPVRL